MSAAPGPSPFLIMGEQRSGTTFLLQVLATPPDVAVRAGLLSRVLSQAWRWRLDLDTPLPGRKRLVLLRALRRFWAPPGDLPALPLEPDDFETLGELLEVAFACSAPAARLSGHKVHGPAPFLTTLLRIPRLRVIYIIRDVRDVILSRRSRGDVLLDSHVLRWRRAVRHVQRLQDHPRLHVLRFEELLRAPHAELARLRSFLGAAPEPADVRIEPQRFNTSFRDLAFPFDRRASERWRSHWDEPLMRYASWVCWRELAALDYDITSVRTISRRERRRFAARLARAETLHAAAQANDFLARLLLSAWHKRARGHWLRGWAKNVADFGWMVAGCMSPKR